MTEYQEDELWKLADVQREMNDNYLDLINTTKGFVSPQLAQQYTQRETFPRPKIPGVWKKDEVRAWLKAWFEARRRFET